MILEAGIAKLEVALPALDWGAFLWVIPELGKAIADTITGWDLFKKLECDFVLGFDPGSGFGRVRVLEPTVGVGNLRTVIVVNLIDGIRLRVGEFAQLEASFPMGRREIVSEGDPIRLTPSKAAVL